MTDQQTIDRVQVMAEESLDPASLENWEGIKGILEKNREGSLPFQTDPGVDIDQFPCHTNYDQHISKTPTCPGIFNQVKEGKLVCNECGMGLLELLDSLCKG